MWFWFAIIALLCWSGSDLFSKIGCRDNDKYAHLKMVIAVGVVMGLHAAFEIFVQGTSVTWHIIWTYLPVSLLYIVSMALGYVGLRYIELSISSPICNSSGALVAVLCLITGTLDESIQGGMRVAVIGAVARGVSLSMERSFFGSTGMDPFGGYGGFSDFAGSGTIWYDSAGNVISSPFGSSGMGSSGFTNPVAILGTVIIVIGVVMLIAGIILAVYLKKRGNTK